MHILTKHESHQLKRKKNRQYQHLNRVAVLLLIHVILTQPCKETEQNVNPEMS